MLTHRRNTKHKIHLNFLNDDVFTQKEPKLEVSNLLETQFHRLELREGTGMGGGAEEEEELWD